MHTHLHNVKEKEMEFGHVSVIGEKEKNKHMLVVSDTSFCSNNSKNVCFIFKTKFCWHSLYAAVEILSLFLKEKKIYMTELLCCSRTESHRVCELCLFSRNMLFVSFSAHWLLAYFCPLQIHSGTRIWRGYMNYPSRDGVSGSLGPFKLRTVCHWT